MYRKLQLISPSTYKPPCLQAHLHGDKKIHPLINPSGYEPPSSFSYFINIKHSQRVHLLQQITIKDHEKYEKLRGCELDIKTLTNDGGNEL